MKLKNRQKNVYVLFTDAYTNNEIQKSREMIIMKVKIIVNLYVREIRVIMRRILRGFWGADNILTRMLSEFSYYLHTRTTSLTRTGSTRKQTEHAHACKAKNQQLKENPHPNAQICSSENLKNKHALDNLGVEMETEILK